MLVPHPLSLQEFPQLPALLEFLLGLQEIPAVSPEQGFVVRDQSNGIGPREPTDKLDSLVLRGDILAGMLVGAGKKVEVPLPLLHECPDLC